MALELLEELGKLKHTTTGGKKKQPTDLSDTSRFE